MDYMYNQIYVTIFVWIDKNYHPLFSARYDQLHMNDEFNLVETKTSSNPMKWFFFQPEKSFNKLTLIKMMCIGVFILSQLKLTLILWNYGVSHSISFLFSTLHRLYHWKNPLARWLFALHSNRLSIFQCLTV